jgi:ubiquinone/menaquinone biosynthesis C-methylase UbiE
MDPELPFSFLGKLSKIKGVYFDDDKRLPDTMESLYTQLRSKEQRMHSDQEVRTLPALKNHIHSKEWAKRSRSAKRILSYFEKRPAGKILDLGCGNGWFTHQLAIDDKHVVLGLDLNIVELEQAARLFASQNVQFLYGDLYSPVLPSQSFNYVTVGAAVQYFKDLPGLLNRLFQLVKAGGEIHFFDSPFYSRNKVKDAGRRSADYYSSLGFAEMINHYHHHVLEDLSGYNYDILYKPQTNPVLKAFLNNGDVPFPWIRIQSERNEKEESQKRKERV